MPPKLTPDIIAAAILGFEGQKAHIDGQIAELRAMLSGSPAENAMTTEPATRKRRKMSAAGRKAIAEAQRKRWAASKGQAEAATPEQPKPKRKLSAAGRKAISEATKKRWAAVHAAAAKTKPTPPPAKKAAAKKTSVKKSPVKVAKKAAAKKLAKKPAPRKTDQVPAQAAE